MTKTENKHWRSIERVVAVCWVKSSEGVRVKRRRDNKQRVMIFFLELKKKKNRWRKAGGT